ncbi:hypothetical protein FA95DRAFT_1607968 [Auriscalpium vulgare]|uniref:Uncharacterized protein n=1 Tax=Auriscalpium vulgare TaxID=40419 RepID=A0ACB8RLN4_9AGAM|nr:hypothetical protein FA95DRAFT_1607968 [Auriscalpium vulgare]
MSSTLPGYVTGPIRGTSRYYAVMNTQFAGVYTSWSTVCTLRDRFPELDFMELSTYSAAFDAVQGARATNDLIDGIGNMSLYSAPPPPASPTPPPSYIAPHRASANTAPPTTPVRESSSSSSAAPGSSSPAADHLSPAGSSGDWGWDVEENTRSSNTASSSWGNNWGGQWGGGSGDGDGDGDGDSWNMPHATWSDYDRAEAAEREAAEAAKRNASTER